VANCVWWIAGIIRLDSGLTIFIDNLETRKPERQHQISAIPRDIARAVSADSELNRIEEELSARYKARIPRKPGQVQKKIGKRQQKRLARNRNTI
jgi:hypothetical protein